MTQQWGQPTPLVTTLPTTCSRTPLRTEVEKSHMGPHLNVPSRVCDSQIEPLPRLRVELQSRPPSSERLASTRGCLGQTTHRSQSRDPKSSRPPYTPLRPQPPNSGRRRNRGRPHALRHRGCRVGLLGGDDGLGGLLARSRGIRDPGASGGRPQTDRSRDRVRCKRGLAPSLRTLCVSTHRLTRGSL